MLTLKVLRATACATLYRWKRFNGRSEVRTVETHLGVYCKNCRLDGSGARVAQEGACVADVSSIDVE